MIDRTVPVQYMKEISSALQREVLLNSGNWPTSAVANTTLATVYLPETILKYHKMAQAKLYGSYSFKATCVLRVQFNANRFQAGMIGLFAFPREDVARTKFAHACSHITLRSQLPHVYLDLSKQNEMQFKIPYISPYGGFDLTTGLGRFGVVTLAVVSPLSIGADATENSLGYSIYGHFEDVEIFGDSAPSTNVLPAVQSDNRRVKEQGPISSVLGKVSKASTILGDIPLLAPIAKPVAWVSSVFANAVSVFGWSRPTILAKPTFNKVLLSHGLASADGVDTSEKLAIRGHNELSILTPFGGSDQDQLSIGYIKRIPCIYNNQTWDVTDLAESEITTIYLRPCAFEQSITTGSHTGRILSPVAFLGRLFRYWRGSFNIRFRFVKTAFHNGRIMVAYMPGTTNFTFAQANNLAIKHIINICDNDEVVINFPYVNVKPWIRDDDICGTVKVFVLNPLRAPETVAQSIALVEEVWGGDDLEFAVPFVEQGNQFYYDVTDRVLQMDGTEVTEITTQVVEPDVDPLLPGKDIQTDPVLASYTVGEVVSSLRSILSRPHQYIYSSCSNTGVFSGFISKPHNIAPLCLQSNNTMLLPIPETLTSRSSYQGVDPYSVIGSCYAFFRGSMRVKVKGNNSYSNSLVMLPQNDTRTIQQVSITNPQALTGSLIHSRLFNTPYTGISPMVEGEVPFYSDLPFQPVYFSSGYSGDDSTTYPKYESYRNQASSLAVTSITTELLSPTPNVVYVSYGGTNNLHFRSIGDDFQMGYWTSPPLYREGANSGVLDPGYSL